MEQSEDTLPVCKCLYTALIFFFSLSFLSPVFLFYLHLFLLLMGYIVVLYLWQTSKPSIFQLVNRTDLSVSIYCQKEYNFQNTIHSVVICYMFQPSLTIIRWILQHKGNEYRGGDLLFTINTFKYVKFRLLFPIKE